MGNEGGWMRVGGGSDLFDLGVLYTEIFRADDDAAQ